jgi:hypothetical protein
MAESSRKTAAAGRWCRALSISPHAERQSSVDSQLPGTERAMKYICLVYLVEKDMNAMSKSEADACTEESLAYDDTLRKAGHFIVAHALQPVEAATTIRVRSGRVSTTDGPFAETKEQLGGFILIEARDLNEAIQVASKIPMARRGSIEVRPIRELQP